jgi:hypothetical protein
MKRLMLLAAVALFALAALLPGLAAPAHAQTTVPASLQGEYLVASEQTAQGRAEVSSTCTPAEGETMTFTFRAEGVAIGPYPGTFTESGTAKATLPAPVVFPTGGASAFGTVIEWKSTFTILSPAGKVTGTKTLSQVVPSFGAVCVRGHIAPILETRTDEGFIVASLEYEATIKPPTGGTFTDQGEASGFASHSCTSISAPCDVRDVESFSEYFALSTGVLPADTHGKATGGGQIMSGSNPFERVTFGFNVRKSEDDTRLKGTCNVLDHATNTHIKCTTVTDYQQIGNTATWEGSAEVNGVEEDYRITVTDNGEPNQGLDTFSIKTDSYEAAGNVQHGNVQIHKQAITL